MPLVTSLTSWKGTNVYNNKNSEHAHLPHKREIIQYEVSTYTIITSQQVLAIGSPLEMLK